MFGQVEMDLSYDYTWCCGCSIKNFSPHLNFPPFHFTRNYAYPRPVAMAVVQVIMAIGLFYYAMGWPGEIYVVSVLIGLGYGAHWAIVPAAASELFGLKSFGALYNFLTLASPAGSLIFSGVIASGIYDYEAKKQASLNWQKLGNITPLDESSSLTCNGTICYSITCAIMSGLCVIAVVLSLIVVHRTKRVYAQLYGKSLSWVFAVREWKNFRFSFSRKVFQGIEANLLATCIIEETNKAYW